MQLLHVLQYNAYRKLIKLYIVLTVYFYAVSVDEHHASHSTSSDEDSDDSTSISGCLSLVTTRIILIFV